MSFIYSFKLSNLIFSILFFLLIVILFPKLILTAIISGILFAYITQQSSLAFFHYSQSLQQMIFGVLCFCFYFVKFIVIAAVIAIIGFLTKIAVVPFLLSFLIALTFLLFIIGIFYSLGKVRVISREGG